MRLYLIWPCLALGCLLAMPPALGKTTHKPAPTPVTPVVPVTPAPSAAGTGGTTTAASASKTGATQNAPDFQQIPEKKTTQLSFSASSHQERGGLNSQSADLTMLRTVSPRWGAGGSLNYSNDASWRIAAANLAVEFTPFKKEEEWKMKPFIIGLLGVARTQDKSLATKSNHTEPTYGGRAGVNIALSDSYGIQLYYQAVHFEHIELTKTDIGVGMYYSF